MRRAIIIMVTLGMVGACGPASGREDGDGESLTCNPGAVADCYDGVQGTEGVAGCHGGTKTCNSGSTWDACAGQVVPTQELCGDGIDNNCNGAVDEDVDADGDGVTTCDGDCCDSTECTNPAAVNPGAFDVVGDNVDNDCNGVIDDAQSLCDTGLASGSMNAMDYAKAIDLCQTATATDRKWGVISATLTLADGSGVPAARAQSIRNHFGTGVMPQGGASMALLSTGAAASVGDMNPGYEDFQDANSNNKQSGFPSDFVAANGNKLPNAPGCPGPSGNQANDPVMLTLTVRVPTNAKSFKLATNFFSSEFPEFTCTRFNDFFVVLLDSTYSGSPANPTDKNLATYTSAGGQKYPVGVNLAFGNTGLFTQCVNGPTGCAPGGIAGTITTCTGIDQLAGTGLDKATPGECDGSAREGGGTGWLETSGNVVPGETIKLRIAIWDTSDHALDSIALVDGFKWDADTSMPGTVILRSNSAP